jgi:SAM-dependent methyltransferase
VASLPSAPGIALHLATFACLTLAVHGRLASERPPLGSLTAFYLAMSLGGAIGGLVGGLLAPVAFPAIWEYPLGIVACALWLTPHLGIRSLRRPAAVVAGVLLVVATVLRVTTTDADGPARGVQFALALAFVAVLVWADSGRQVAGFLLAGSAIALALPGAAVLEQQRTYYGVTRVLEDADGWHLLVSGTTVHGAQDPTRPDVPLTYYAPGSPLTDAMRAAGPGGSRSVGVVGLGAGSMAAWTEAGDELTFYEIDPAVIDIATDPDLFTFIADAAGDVRILEGDGRLLLAGSPPGTHDLIVIDAFSSDAIPVHLVTREALATYRAALAPGGIVTFHISNRYFDLAPVVTALAADAGLASLVGEAVPSVEGAFPTLAVAIGEPDDLAELAALPNWRTVEPGPTVWTDDRADVLGALDLR